MPNNLICPKCGIYQPNDKTERKLVAGVKNASKYAIRVGTKFVAKNSVEVITESVGIGFFGKGVGKLAGKGVDYVFDKMGVKTQPLSSIKYRCHSCGQQWDGHDCFEKFNDIQKTTVESKRKDDMSDKYINFMVYVFLTVISLGFMAVAFWIYSNRYVEIETTSTWLFGDMQTKNYSWHYYVFWPMAIIFGCMVIGFLCVAIRKYEKFATVKNMTLENYAKEIMDL